MDPNAVFLTFACIPWAMMVFFQVYQFRFFWSFAPWWEAHPNTKSAGDSRWRKITHPTQSCFKIGKWLPTYDSALRSTRWTDFQTTHPCKSPNKRIAPLNHLSSKCLNPSKQIAWFRTPKLHPRDLLENASKSASLFGNGRPRSIGSVPRLDNTQGFSRRVRISGEDWEGSHSHWKLRRVHQHGAQQ